MHKIYLTLACALTSLWLYATDAKPVLIEDFNRGWFFHRGETAGAQYSVTADSTWRIVDILHDWSIENLQGSDSPFDPNAVTGISGGFTTGGLGWYRKHFYAAEGFASDRFILMFDGIYMNADVWVNNCYVGNHIYGYTNFEYDITKLIRFGTDNLIAVRVRNDGLNCRWYTGSGIYREAALKIISPLHLVSHGTFVTTPEISTKSAKVQVVSTIANMHATEKQAVVKLTFFNKQTELETIVEKEIKLKAGKTTGLIQESTIDRPVYWSPEDPYLYQVTTEITVDGKVVDCTKQSFGIRTISFDATNGFQLNGKTHPLKGGCIHHDNGPLGSKAYPRAEERKIELLKKAGFNALRMAHNPPSKALLEACDRLGMLVIDEAFDSWRYGHYPNYDFSQYFDKIWQHELSAMILRDRNHPSVIMWSIGNEIGGKDTPEIVAIARELRAYVREMDPTRPVTAGVNAITNQSDDFLATLDVCGYNYAPEHYLSDHKRHPDRVIYCSESYASEAYDYWEGVKKYPWVIGDFVWTAFDYLGEASIGWCGYPLENRHYPWNHAFCGDIDINGSRRPQNWYRETLWSENPVASLFITPPVPSFPVNPAKEKWSVWDWNDAVKGWNFPRFEDKTIEVLTYTNCHSAELFLNGRSLGKREKKESEKNILRWNVPYSPGELKVIGYMGQKQVATERIQTSGEATRFQVIADRRQLKADGKDLSYVSIRLTDDKGILNPIAENNIHFTITGDATLEAVSNANPMSTEAFVATKRKAWRGECMAIVRSGYTKGTALLTISAAGFEPVSIPISLD